MLERYFKNRKEFEKHLDRTYDPDKFKKSFTAFLQQLGLIPQSNSSNSHHSR